MKIILSLLVIFIAAVFCCKGNSEEAILLTQDGTTEYRIMAGASETEEFAAQELQGYVMQVSGAFLPRADRNDFNSGKLIIVGESAAARLGLHIQVLEKLDDKASVDENNPDADGFVIKTYGNMIILAGRSPRGTLYSVYAFLESIGCRWLAPGILGEVIPMIPTISIPPTERYEQPDMKYRGFISIFPVTYRNAQWIDWMSKNRLNYILVNLSEYSDIKKITGGEIKRRGMYISVRLDAVTPEDEKLDANEAGRKIANHILQFINNNPEVDIIEIPSEFFSDQKANKLQIMTEVTQLIHKSYPEKLISLLMQGEEVQIPVNYSCQPNSFFSFELASRCYRHDLGDEQCPINRKNKAYLNGLLKICDRVQIYEHYMGSYEQNSLPFPILQTIASDMELFSSQKKIDGAISSCEFGNWGTYGLNYYVFARKAWNVRYSLGSIVDDYCEKYYGTSSNSMRKYFSTLEDAMIAKEHFQYVDPPELITELLNADIIKELEFNIRNAENLATDAMVFDRIRKTRFSLDYTVLLWNMLDNYSRGVKLQETKNRTKAKEHFQKTIELGEKLVAFLFKNVEEDVFIITEDYIFNYLEPVIADARERNDLLEAR